jgi:hypothetical protein
MRTRSPCFKALARGLARVAIVVALASCSDDGQESLEVQPGATRTRDAGRDDATVETDAGAPPAEAVFGWRSDWFDLFADRKASRVDDAIAIAIATRPDGIRDMLYSTRFAARVKVATGAEHTFSVTSDDGIRVFVDGAPLIESWKLQGPTPVTKSVALTAGEHDVRVEYFQLRGGATLDFSVTPAFAEVRPAPPSDDGPRPSFTNPVVPFDCPDPGLMTVPGEHLRWVMVCTGGKMPIRVSDDLVTWKDSGQYILPSGKASWSANGGRNWAPEIHEVGSEWVAYYTAVNGSDVLSIGCAYAQNADGPYTDCGAPLVQHPQGVIDATFFEDTDGKRYLYYKIDGNSVGQPTPIYVRELAPNGRSFAAGSTQTLVLTNDAATWEGGVVEAPWIIKHGAYYYLFYSGNVYDHRYRTGVARATSPKGPFTKKGAPILGNNSKWVGPGHGTVLTVHGKEYFFHHAWPALANGTHDGPKGRYGLIAPVEWANDWPVVGGGTSVTTPIAWP